MKRRLAFYRDTVSRWIADRSASILVVAGAANDRDVFLGLGFTNVVISNLDAAATGDATSPYRHSRQDVESLTYRDGEFDYVVVHAGLHHCHSPHRGLLEMYRVAGKAVVGFEPPDNLLVRMMQRAGLAQVYEYTAVSCQAGRAGGVNNSEIPNYIYRWRRRDIEQTILACAPHAAHRFRYAHASDAPTREFVAGSRFKTALVAAGMPLYRLLGACFPRQRNLFAFMIEKPVLTRDLHPWLRREDGEVRYDPLWGEHAP
jgi:SAM-dependent methyltransferase